MTVLKIKLLLFSVWPGTTGRYYKTDVPRFGIYIRVIFITSFFICFILSFCFFDAIYVINNERFVVTRTVFFFCLLFMFQGQSLKTVAIRSYAITEEENVKADVCLSLYIFRNNVCDLQFCIIPIVIATLY